jgi:adenosylcobinamide-phosphate synthase
MDNLIILFIALAIDLIFGEPDNIWHPVAWLGKLISLETKWMQRRNKKIQIFLGTIIVLLTTAVITAAIYFIILYLRTFNLWIYVIFTGLLFKSTFSFQGLRRAIVEVKNLLSGNEIIRARQSLKALVSRNTDDLDNKQIISATVESAAESICDSFSAPIFYFLFFGVPGAVAYRIINTFDSMIGYYGEWEYTGKFAARLDDVVNFIPARITALIIVLSALFTRKNMQGAWKIMLRDHFNTKSPNAGWTMSAMAGALGVQLEKTGHYKLGDNLYPLSLETITDSQHLLITVVSIWSFFVILAEVIYIVVT